MTEPEQDICAQVHGPDCQESCLIGTGAPGRDRRRYFDTSKFGKKAVGHTFPDSLDESEKKAVLEYLKTL